MGPKLGMARARLNVRFRTVTRGKVVNVRHLLQRRGLNDGHQSILYVVDAGEGESVRADTGAANLVDSSGQAIPQADLPIPASTERRAQGERDGWAWQLHTSSKN